MHTYFIWQNIYINYYTTKYKNSIHMLQKNASPDEISLGEKDRDITLKCFSEIKSWSLPELSFLRAQFKLRIIDTLIKEKKEILWVDGFDGARKTSITEALTNPSRIYHRGIVNVESLGVPDKHELNRPIIENYKVKFPGKWKTLFFDRTWNNRAFVQNIMWYCSPELYNEYIETLPRVLDSLIADGFNVTNFFFNIDKETQEKRLHQRSINPEKVHRYSPTDKKSLENHDRLREELHKIDAIYKNSPIDFVKVQTKHKETAMIQILRYLLYNSSYEWKQEINKPDPNIIQSNKYS